MIRPAIMHLRIILEILKVSKQENPQTIPEKEDRLEEAQEGGKKVVEIQESEEEAQIHLGEEPIEEGSIPEVLQEMLSAKKEKQSFPVLIKEPDLKVQPMIP